MVHGKGVVSTVDIGLFLREAAGTADAALERFLPSAKTMPARLHEAMRYAVFAGGKRVRPALVLAAYRAVASDAAGDERCRAAMAAVEILHTYTLVHDDLPAMDDDDLRRGRQTCHKAFDEATAILAGDALLTLSFEVVAALGADAVVCLARAAGSLGTVGGQQEDLEAEGLPIDPALKDRLERIHRGKTAALIRASCELGAIAGGADAKKRQGLAAFGGAIGLAFQIADDVLDGTASAEVLGKTPGKDLAQRKLTYVSLYGLEAAMMKAKALRSEALAALHPLGERGALLADLATFIIERKH